ncbi:MAG: NADH-quinone oxidoreductase subunit A [Lewinellaceae bacterium]|nr:NADH-quinone oxidoreductase subunit A [Lewinellaceae bacterium]MCB9288270.1 NADH-quinone oxidoreductase subunit A [Lewinellaceae bacterium]
MLAYAAIVLVAVTAILILSYLLGQRHAEKATGEVFESGIMPTGSARLHFSSDFYLIAMFFVIFDLETAFIVAWAIGYEEAGWPGFIGALVFVGILLVVLAYEWSTGALDYGPKGRKILKALKKRKQKK